MSESTMTDRQMTVTLGPQTQVAAGKGGPATLLGQVGKGNLGTAPFQGPAVFSVPVVLPKTGRIRSCELTVKASAASRVKVGSKDLGPVPAGKAKKITIDAKAFEKGKDFVIEELSFADFKQVDIVVKVDAPKSKSATLSLQADLDYQIPMESAADYLNYIMTQA
ncbi:MAG: hypothetical protein IT443_01155 [Phycisphaeraceae bacterium]|nr:hypothetical protein [Phycisphaeraceae bacterium]